MGKRLFALALALLVPLGACSAEPDLPAGPVPLDPIAFFTGRTGGQGTLRPVVGKSSPIKVDSLGTPTPTGLRLVQRIAQRGKAPRTRVWLIERAGPGRFTGSLTDAKGPVTMEVRGPRAFIAYATPSGIRIRQELALQADGTTILNRLEAHRFGLRLATLGETIRKEVEK